MTYQKAQTDPPRTAPMVMAILLLPAVWFAISAAVNAGEPVKKVDFNFQVRPILSDKCFNCHGPDSRQRKAGLRLDTKTGAFGLNKSGGHAIVCGNLDD